MLKKLILSVSVSLSVFADDIHIFSASSTKEAISEIIKKFEQTHKDDKVNVTFGASGEGYTRFHNGLKYDIFLSADQTYPDKIVSDGDAISDAKIYAKGVIALYSKNQNYLNIENLNNSEIKKIAVANPKTAPYGALAIRLLVRYDLYNQVSNKLVFGNNIAQTVQFVDSGNAEVGLVAFSLVKTTKDSNSYKLVDSSKYDPLPQSFVITKYAKDKKLAFDFANYLTSQESRGIFNKYGFE